MKKHMKTKTLIQVVATFACACALMTLMTMKLAYGSTTIAPTYNAHDSKVNSSNMTNNDSPAHLTTIDDALSAHYQGRVTLRWHNVVENTMCFNIETDDMPGEICVSLNEFAIPESLSLYTDRVDVYMDVTLFEEPIIYDWYLVDKATGKNLGKPTDEELNYKYELEGKYPVVIMGNQPDTIYLSNLKPDTIYSYTLDVENHDNYPNVINDTGIPCILYTKHHGFDDTYGMYACPTVMIVEETASTFTCALYEEGGVYRIMYSLSDDETLNNIAQDEVINITELLGGINSFYMYVYNDTHETYQVTFTSNWKDNPQPIIITVQPGKLFACWGPAYTVSLEKI